MRSTDVIKAHANHGTPLVSLIKKETHDALLEAKNLLAEGERRATGLIEEAERAKEALFAESVASGYAAGLEQWNETLVESRRQRNAYLSRNEAELVALAVAVVRKIVRHSAQSDTEMVMRAAREAIKSVSTKHRLTIKVNPEEEVFVRQQAASLNLSGKEAGEVVIVGHASVDAGGCIVESELGIIDARIETQIAALEKVLLKRFHVCDR